VTRKETRGNGRDAIIFSKNTQTSTPKAIGKDGTTVSLSGSGNGMRAFGRPIAAYCSLVLPLPLPLHHPLTRTPIIPPPQPSPSQPPNQTSSTASTASSSKTFGVAPNFLCPPWPISGTWSMDCRRGGCGERSLW